MQFNGEVTQEPYACDPTNPELFCQIYFNVHEDDTLTSPVASNPYVINDCKCSMADNISGFCSSVLGTDFYTKAVQAQK
jgi:hypothetical protein